MDFLLIKGKKTDYHTECLTNCKILLPLLCVKYMYATKIIRKEKIPPERIIYIIGTLGKRLGGYIMVLGNDE